MFPTPAAPLHVPAGGVRGLQLSTSVSFSVIVMLVNVQRCLLVVLTCILLPDDVEHRFMCLLCV